MIEIICEHCKKPFFGRPNRHYCGPECRREAEMVKRRRKKRAEFDIWVASLPPNERAFWDDLKEFSTEGLKEFPTEDLKEFEI